MTSKDCPEEASSVRRVRTSTMRQCGKSTMTGGILVIIILLLYMLTIQPSFRQQSDIDAKRDILWLEKLLQEKQLKEKLAKVKQNENTRINYFNSFDRWENDNDDDDSDEEVDGWPETSQMTTMPTSTIQPYSETGEVDQINVGFPLFRGWMFGNNDKPIRGSTTEFLTTTESRSSSTSGTETTTSPEIKDIRNTGYSDKSVFKKWYNNAANAKKPFKVESYEAQDVYKQKNNRFMKPASTTSFSSSSMTTVSSFSTAATTATTTTTATLKPSVDNTLDSDEVANKEKGKGNENKVKSIEPMRKTSVQVQAENDTPNDFWNKKQEQNEPISKDASTLDNAQIKTRILSRLLLPNTVVGVNKSLNEVHAVNKNDTVRSQVVQKPLENAVSKDLIIGKPIDTGSNATSNTAKFSSGKNVQLEHAFVPKVNSKLDTFHLVTDNVNTKIDHGETEAKVPNANNRVLSIQTLVRQEMSSQNITKKTNSSTVNIPNMENQIKDKTNTKTEIEAFMKLNLCPKYMNVFDWNTPLRSTSVPQCVPMNTISSFVRICIHPISEDPVVSSMIKSMSTWEFQSVRDVQFALLKFDDSGLIDLGAGIGPFSLAAASIKRRVIAVEPYLPHVEMFQTSVLLNKLKPFVTLLRNVVSNKHEKFIASHVAGHINDVGFRPYSGGEKNDTVIESITLNDLADCVPFKTVVLKIDIPNFTRRCLAESGKFFNKKNVAYVFMHWDTTNEPLCRYLVDFFVGKGYRPYAELNAKELNTAAPLQWPRQSVIWQKIIK